MCKGNFFWKNCDFSVEKCVKTIFNKQKRKKQKKVEKIKKIISREK